MAVPPGVYYLISCIPVLVFPQLLTYFILHTLNRTGYISTLPTFLSLSLYVLSTPVVLYAKRFARDVYERQRAWRLDAKIVPTINGTLPGNVDLVWNLITRLKYEYAGNSMGMFFSDEIKTFSIETMGDRRREFHFQAISVL